MSEKFAFQVMDPIPPSAAAEPDDYAGREERLAKFGFKYIPNIDPTDLEKAFQELMSKARSKEKLAILNQLSDLCLYGIQRGSVFVEWTVLSEFIHSDKVETSVEGENPLSTLQQV